MLETGLDVQYCRVYLQTFPIPGVYPYNSYKHCWIHYVSKMPRPQGIEVSSMKLRIRRVKLSCKINIEPFFFRGVLSRFPPQGRSRDWGSGGERPEPLVERFLFTIALSQKNCARKTLKRLPEDTGFQNLKSSNYPLPELRQHNIWYYYTRIAKQGKYKKG